MRERKLTPYKLAVLSTLRWNPRTARTCGGNASHFERACREMEQMGLTAKNLHGVWRIRPAGNQALEDAGR
jgi:hypothetical protein